MGGGMVVRRAYPLLKKYLRKILFVSDAHMKQVLLPLRALLKIAYS